MNTEIAEKIKNMLVENLRIPADELEYTSCSATTSDSTPSTPSRSSQVSTICSAYR